MKSAQLDEAILLGIAVALILWWMLQQVPKRELPLSGKVRRPQRDIRAQRGRSKTVDTPIAQLRPRKAKEVRGNTPSG